MTDTLAENPVADSVSTSRKSVARPDPRPGRLGTFLAVLGIMALPILIQVAVGFAFSAASLSLLGSSRKLPASLVTSMMVGASALGWGLFLLVARLSRVWEPEVRAEARRLGAGLPRSIGAFAALLGFSVFSVAGASLLGAVCRNLLGLDQKPVSLGLGYTDGLPLFLLGALTIVVLVPFCEELVFRALIFTRLARAFSSTMVVLLTSLLFAICHFNLPQGVSVFFLGLVAAYGRLVSGGIFLGVVVHVLNNLLALVVPLLSLAKEENVPPSAGEALWMGILAAVFLTVAYGCLRKYMGPKVR